MERYLLLEAVNRVPTPVYIFIPRRLRTGIRLLLQRHITILSVGVGPCCSATSLIRDFSISFSLFTIEASGLLLYVFKALNMILLVAYELGCGSLLLLGGESYVVRPLGAAGGMFDTPTSTSSWSSLRLPFSVERRQAVGTIVSI